MQRTFLSFFFCFFSTIVLAQDQLIIPSPSLPHPDTVWVFKPTEYSAGKHYGLLYLLHGYGENYRQWSHITDLQKAADEYQLVIVCPEGFQTWYLNSPLDKHSRFDDFFFYDLKPLVHEKYNIDPANIFISGLSMGGYGALRMFSLQPAYFNTAASTSGGVDVDVQVFHKASMLFFGNDRVNIDLAHALGNPAKVDWRRYSTAALLRKGALKGRAFLLDCGTQDILLPMNNALKKVCDSLQLPVTYTTQPGVHDAAYWSKSIRQHLLYFQEHWR